MTDDPDVRWTEGLDAALAGPQDRHAPPGMRYGQVVPFGTFTPKDVAALTDILGVVDWDNIEGLRDSLTSVRAKIRALLP